MKDIFNKLIRTLLVVGQLSFISPMVPRSVPSQSSTNLSRNQSAPRPEDIRFLAGQSKVYSELKILTDTALIQAKKVDWNPSSANLAALRKTHGKLLEYQKNGLELAAPVLRVIENVLIRHRRNKHG